MTKWLMGLLAGVATIAILTHVALTYTPPDKQTELGVKMGACPDGQVVTFTYYSTKPDAEDAEYYTIEGKHVVAVIFFDDKDNSARTVILLHPMHDEKITMEKLMDRYPSPCDLVKAMEGGTV